jgi:hypothetical protein
MRTVRMFCIMVGSIVAAFLVPLAARAWLVSPRPVEAPVRAAIWQDAQQISTNITETEGMKKYPALAAGGENVYAVWSKQEISGSTDYDPTYNWSDSYGDLDDMDSDYMWDGDIRIQQTGYDTPNVDVSVDDTGDLHFVWSEATVSPNYTLYYSYTQAPSVQEIAEANASMVPAIAVGNGGVHVAWTQGISDVIYISKTIGSGDWSSSPTTTVRSSSPLANPAIAVSSDGRVHVAWDEGGGSDAEILYRNSSNWSSDPITLSQGVSNGSHAPALAVSGDNNVYAVWCEYADISTQWVRFAQSTNKGDSWSSSERVFADSLAAHIDVSTYLWPSIAVDSNGKLHVVFNGLPGGSSYEEIYYVSRSGSNWTSRDNVSDSGTENSTTPDVAVSGDWVHVIWAETASDGEYEVIYTRRSTTAGNVIYLPLILKSY